jgi:hypothetical protein
MVQKGHMKKPGTAKALLSKAWANTTRLSNGRCAPRHKLWVIRINKNLFKEFSCKRRAEHKNTSRFRAEAAEIARFVPKISSFQMIAIIYRMLRCFIHRDRLLIAFFHPRDYCQISYQLSR